MKIEHDADIIPAPTRVFVFWDDADADDDDDDDMLRLFVCSELPIMYLSYYFDRWME